MTSQEVEHLKTKSVEELVNNIYELENIVNERDADIINLNDDKTKLQTEKEILEDRLAVVADLLAKHEFIENTPYAKRTFAMGERIHTVNNDLLILNG